MADLLISPQAEMDLDRIWLYIAKESQSVERAERFLDRFAAFFSRLAKNPYLGRQREDLRYSRRTGRNGWPITRLMRIRRSFLIYAACC